MAIILPGIDVGPTGSKALSVGAASALDRVPHYYPPIVNRLLAVVTSGASGILGGFGRRTVGARQVEARVIL